MSNQLAEVRDIFTGEQVNPFEINTELAEYITPSVVEVFADYGVPDEIIGIFATHVSKLHVAMSPEGSTEESHLSLFRSNERDEYRRLAVINPIDIARRSNTLRAESRQQGIDVPKRVADFIGVEWSLFELTGDALSNSVYMQNRFERYIADTNVQCGFDSDLHVAKSFFEEYSGEPTRAELEALQEAFKKGIALEVLPDEIVRRGVTDNLKKAEWITNGIRANYPLSLHQKNAKRFDVQPMSTLDISRFLGVIVVRPALKEAFDYSDRWPLVEEDLALDDYDDTPSSGILYPVEE